MQLEYRFSMILIFCLVVGLTVAGLISYRIETRQAEAEIVHNAELLMEVAMSIRAYTITEVRPLLKKYKTGDFLPQTVPSYSAQKTLETLKTRFPDLSYREVALNPTNIADRANDWEVGLIRQFQTNANTHELSGVVNQNDHETFYVARPIRITNPDCLACHSEPDNAPEAMLQKYGRANGFGWKLNEVIGTQIVEVPTGLAWTSAKNSIVITLGTLLLIFLMTFVIFMLAFRRYVSYPLESITRVTNDISLDKTPQPSDETNFGGQFSILEKAINRLRTTVTLAIEKIDRRT